MTPRVSVVVPTYRRPELLARCLAALLNQDFDRGEYEIIVADNAAPANAVGAGFPRPGQGNGPGQGDPAPTMPGILRVIEQALQEAAAKATEALPAQVLANVLSASGNEMEYAERGHISGWAVAPELPTIRWVAAGSRRGPAAARNDGWRAAQGEIIAFTDDDCIPAPGWLAAGIETFDNAGRRTDQRDERVVGVSGRIVMPLPPRPTDYELNATGLVRSEFVTANCFYRKDALEAVGGFDERFTIAWREDSDLFFTLLRHYDERPGSPRFPANPNAVVYHPVRPAPWGVSLRQQARVQFNALLYKKHSQFYRERLAPVTPWHYYVVLASLIGVVIGLTSGLALLAAAGALLWVLLTARFAWRRLRGTSHDPGHVWEMVVTSVLIPPLALYWRLRGAVKHRVLFL